MASKLRITTAAEEDLEIIYQRYEARGNHGSSSRLAFRMAENGINSVLRYRRGFSTTVANGGSVRLIEQGRPWLGISSPCTPG